MNLFTRMFGRKDQTETPACRAGAFATEDEGIQNMLLDTAHKSKIEGVETLFSASASERRRAEAIYDAWMKRYKKSGRFAEFTKITPAIAELLLEHNDENRMVSEHGLRKLATDFKAGNYQVNGESIVIANNGKLNDGQHRLRACVESGVPFETVIVVGVDRQSRETLDQGARRQPGQQLFMLGYKDPTNLAHAGRIYWQLKNLGRVAKGPESQPTWPQILEVIEENRSLTETGYGHRARKAKLGGVGLHTALRTWCASVGGETAAENFFEPVVSGLGFRGARDPAYQLHKRLIEGDRLVEVERAAFVIKAWNAFRAGSQIRILRFVTGEEFPVAE